MAKSAAAQARERASKESGISKRARKAVAKNAADDAATAVMEIPVENNLPATEETPCNPETQVADSDHQTETEPATADLAPSEAPGGRKMATGVTFNLKGMNKRGNQAIYEGVTEDGQRAKGTLRYAVPRGTEAPATLGRIDAEFPVRAKARSEMTPEERKAARAARPKLTLAEKAQKAEERAARLRAQLEKQASQEVAPALT